MKKIVKVVNAILLSGILFLSSFPVFAEELRLEEHSSVEESTQDHLFEEGGTNIDVTDAENLQFDIDFDLDKIESSKPVKNFLEEIEVINVDELEQESLDLLKKEENVSDKNVINEEIGGQIINRKNFSKSVANYSVVENTNPNNAYILPLDNIVNGTITARGQQRWFATEITQRSKMTSSLIINANTDFDLAIFKLDESGTSLNFVSESYLGTGQAEIIDLIVDPGIYYFLVNSYIGTGNFNLTAYTSIYDLQYEINDYTSVATTVANNNFTVSGVIDNPDDFDYYKFNITGTKISSFTFTKPSGTSYNYYLILNGTSAISIESDVPYNVPAGTHYIAVFSNNGSYNKTSPYTVKLVTKNFIPGLGTYVETSDGKNYLQMTADRSTYYINGNLIDFTWSYKTSVNNSAGYINMYMNLYEKSTQFVAMFESELSLIKNDGHLPYFANYSTNFEGVTGTAYPALMLTLIGTDFNVDRYAGGAYANEAVHYTTPYTEVAIDVNTGKVIDVTLYNYYYYYGFRNYTAKYVPTNINYNTRQ